MQYIKLGTSDLNVSRICMGCMGFGDSGRGQHSWTLDEEHSREIIKRGLELGVNFYDTAIAYQSGTSEQYVGRALRDFAKRDEVVVATKFLPRTQEEIIPKELYTMVQEEMARRANLRGVNGKRHIYSGKYALSNTVYCAHCGDVYQRTHWNIHGRKKIVWRCVSRLRSKETEVECKSRTIDESALHQVVVAAVNEVFEQKDGYIDHLKKNVEKVLGEGSDDHTGFVIENDDAEDSQYLEKEDRLIYEHSVEKIQSLPETESKLIALQQEVLQKTRAGENTDDLKIKIDRLQERKYVLQMETARREGIRRRIQDLEDYMDGMSGEITEYDDSLVRKLIEKITVYDDRCDVEFKSGIIVEVYI